MILKSPGFHTSPVGERWRVHGTLMAVVLLVITVPSTAFSNPLRKVIWQHGAKHAAPRLITNTEFHDDIGAAAVAGRVTKLAGGGGAPITGFDLEMTITNNSRFDWKTYIVAFEFAQHDPSSGRHWVSEGYDANNDHGPQPVLITKAFSVFNVPPGPPGDAVVGLQPDVPSIQRSRLKSGDTDTFPVKLGIDAGGAAVGSPLFLYLTEANTDPDGDGGPLLRRDIVWARESDPRGIPDGDYEEPLASNALAATRFDQDGATGRLPGNDNNVSVFPVVEEKVLKELSSVPSTAEFDPVSETLTISPTTVVSLRVVGAPADPRYIGDTLIGAELIVGDLVLDETVNNTHFFTGGRVGVERGGTVFLQGNLKSFTVADLSKSPRFYRSSGALLDLEFPTGVGGSLWLSDIASDLVADDLRSLSLSVEPTDGSSYSDIIASALASGLPVVTEVTVELAITEPVEDDGTAVLDIPTLSQWMLLLFTTLLMAGGAALVVSHRVLPGGR